MASLEQRIAGEIAALEALGFQFREIHSKVRVVGTIVEERQFPEFAEWSTRVLALMNRLGASEFTGPIKAAQQGVQVEARHMVPWNRVLAAQGALQGFKASFNAGLLQDVRTVVRRETHADFLEQAEALLREGTPVPDSLKTAATVLAGAVLEDTLRAMLVKHAVAPPSKPSLSTLNQALRDASVYDKIEWGLVDAWGRLRNGAAHGDHRDVPVEQVQPMIDGVRAFISKHLV